MQSVNELSKQRDTLFNSCQLVSSSMTTNSYPSDWDSRRRRVYERDGYECQNCGRSGGSSGGAELHAHHIVPKAKGGSHNISNLITICEQCHKAVHNDTNAPTTNSKSGYTSQNNSLPRAIKDLNDMGNVSAEVLEAMQEIVEVYKRVLSESNTHYDFLQEGVSFWRKTKDSRRNLVETRLLYKNMGFDFDSHELGDDPEFEYIIAKKEHINLKIIEMGIQKANQVDEYFQLLSNIKCPECGKKESGDTSFCGDCGEELPNAWECSSCGEKLKELKQNYCNSCGSEVTTLPEGRIKKIESVRNNIGLDEEKFESIIKKEGEITKEIKRKNRS